MENKDFNKRILNRLKESIAIEEYRKENNIQKKKKSKVFFKVASFITILGIASANLYTYATFKQDVITYVLDKLGIFNEDNKESLVQVNQTQESNNIALTLENYAIENNTLIIGYKLKANQDTDLGVEYIIDDTNLINNDKTYHLNKSTSMFLSKISDTEYEFLKIYNLGDIKINEGYFLETKLFLPKYLDIGEHVGEWEFKIKLESKNQTLNPEQYTVENVRGTMDWIGETFNMNHTFKVLELENTSLYTKLTILLESYWTGGQKYTIEITDENGNAILEDGIQTLCGGVPTEIILKKLDMNSKINITVTERSGETEITAKGSTVLDLAKDLKPKEERKIEYTTTTWKDLKFKYDKEIKVDKRNSSGYYGYYDSISFGLYTIVGDVRDDTGDGSIQIGCDKNEFNHTLYEIFEEYKAINTVSWRNDLFKNRYPIYLNNGTDVVLNHEQMIELSKNKKVTANGITINSSNYDFSNVECRDVENIKINGIDAITWNEYADKMYIFEYKENIYDIRTSNEINANQRVDEFINNIEFL